MIGDTIPSSIIDITDFNGDEYELEEFLVRRLCDVVELNTAVSTDYRKGFENAIGHARNYIDGV